MRGSYRTRWEIERKLEAVATATVARFAARLTDPCPCCGRPRLGTGALQFLLAECDTPKRNLRTLTPLQAEAKAKAIARRKPIFDRRIVME